LDIQTGRACQAARGLVCFLDSESSRYGLGIFLKGGLSGHQALIVSAGQDHGAYFGTVAASSAPGFIDVPRGFVEGNREISFGPLDLFNFRAGDEIDIQMPADLDQFRRDNSHGAVIGGEGLVQFAHNPADCRGFLDEMNQVSGIGKIKGCLHSGNPSADHHDRSHGFVRHDMLLYR
jgi:hypothetical protein